MQQARLPMIGTMVNILDHRMVDERLRSREHLIWLYHNGDDLSSHRRLTQHFGRIDMNKPPLSHDANKVTISCFRDILGSNEKTMPFITQVTEVIPKLDS